MKQLEHYIQAAIPKPPRILGIQLQPYSLGKFFLLRDAGCTFELSLNELSKQSLEEITWQLLTALSICSRSNQEFLDFKDNKLTLSNEDLTEWPHILWNLFLNKVTKTTYPQRWFDNWTKKLEKVAKQSIKRKLTSRNVLQWPQILWNNWFHKEFNLMGEFVRFKQYTNTALKSPDYEGVGDPPESESGSHITMALFNYLLEQLKDKEKALNFPLSHAISCWCKHLESNGSIRLMADWEVVMREKYSVPPTPIKEAVNEPS